MKMLKRLVFVRSAPLNITPAVERYASFLRSKKFDGEIIGIELNYQVSRPSVCYIDFVIGKKSLFETTIERIFAMLGWQFFLTWHLWRTQPQIVQFCDVFSAIPAMLSKWFGSAKLIFDMRDPVKLSVRHWGRAVSMILGYIETLATINSDAVISVNKSLLEFLPERVRDYTYMIPNAPRQDSFDAFHLSENGNILVNLAGFISYRRNLSAWFEVQHYNKNVKLDIYGAVFDLKTRTILNQNGIHNVYKLSHADSMKRMMKSDLVSLMYDPSLEINRYASPNKYYEALMLGKPILCSQGMMLEHEITEAGCGFAIQYDDANKLSEAIERLKDKSELKRMGMMARRLYEDKYRDLIENTMSEMYTKLGLLPISFK